ncbi:MAG: hypothetical protein R6X19_06855 [Kiritimatiellia bacterium]
MKTAILLSISLREFQVWHDSGELRVPRQRLLPVPLGPDGLPAPDALRVRELMDLLPHVNLDDEHTLLFAQLEAAAPAMGEAGAEPFSPVIVYLPFSGLRRLFPLTPRGQDLLKSRLSGYPVVLAPPLFESAVQALWSEWARRQLLAGARTLLNLLVARPSWRPDPAFAEAAVIAVLSRADGSPARLSPAPLWSRFIGYDRHKPIANTDIGFLYDLGVVLKEVSDRTPDTPLALDPLRTFCAASKNAGRPLPELLADPRLIRILEELDRAPAPGLPLAAAPLFLKWKHLAQQAGRPDIPALLAELQAGAGRLPADILQASVWLTGLFMGFSSFAADYHTRTAPPEGCIGPLVRHQPVDLPPPQPLPKAPRKTRSRKAAEPKPAETAAAPNAVQQDFIE